MGHRLSKIYTRKGDQGTTQLANREKVAKDSLRIEVLGILDELNSSIGLILSQQDLPPEIKTILLQVQHHLFDLGGEICLPDYQAAKQTWVDIVEQHLDRLNADLPPLKEFILPGGTPAAATCHFARTICRNAERRVVTLQRKENLRPEVLKYLNRLSDLLFVIARFLNNITGSQEVLWDHKKLG